jgi:predicted nucleic acid-binding protein
MRIIISDTSCLIDLRKAALLAGFLCLPFEILIPNTLFEDELLSFTSKEKKALLEAGLKVVDLPGAQVSRARDVIRVRPRLSIHDGFAFALAETHDGCILLTGDSELRSLAETSRIEVHGVLWVCDQLFEGKLSSAAQLHAALSQLAADPAVRLPKRELAGYIRRSQTLK